MLGHSNGLRWLEKKYKRNPRRGLTCSKTDCLLRERIWTIGVINKILFLVEIKFTVARNVARGFTLEKYSEVMVSL